MPDSGAAAPPLRDVSPALLARYDRPGPRYTSYPTAVEFSDDIGPDDYARLLNAAAARNDEPLSLYVHLPFCQEMCLFCACHVVISPHYDNAMPYLELLRREIDQVADLLGSRRSVAQLHLGGGTPTFYTPGDLGAMLEHLCSRFTLQPDAEVAIEVDPRVTTTEHLDVLTALGFNRVSMGVQDFTPEVQASIGRVQSRESTERLVRHARRLGVRGLNVDLIYGLPGQELDAFARTIDAVIEMGTDRVAVYSFAYVPWLKGHQRKIDRDALPQRDLKLELFALARARFLDAGFVPLGMDHFARLDDELVAAQQRGELRRNFQGYTVIPAPDVVGLGVSAIGDIGGAYVQNVKKLSEYRDRLLGGRLATGRGIRRSHDDEVRRHVIHEIMCNFRVDLEAVGDRFEIDFATYFSSDLERLGEHVADGMVEIGEGAIVVTAKGQLFVRNLARCFDRYRREGGEASASPAFSRTI